MMFRRFLVNGLVKLAFSFYAITDVNSLLKIENKWNDFIGSYSDNPFLLSGFVKGFMKLAFSKGWRPIILVAFANEEIVGVVPLVLKRRFNAFFASFLFGLHYSPDFVVNEGYRRKFLECALSFLFDDLKCQFLDLVLPLESQNISVLKLICEVNRIYCRGYSTVELGHCVLPVKGSWSNYEKLMGSNFRKYFRRIERKMTEAGGYEVICVDEFGDSVFEDVIYVERRSWKEKWRRQRRIDVDEELLKILEGVKEIDSKISAFKWKVWFLKVNDELASYALTLQFKNVGYIAKTSFNEKHRNFYPGTYISNIAVKDFFERAEAEKIDFQTNLPFMEKWKPLVYPRIRVMMGQKSFYSYIISLSTNRSFCIFRDKILSTFVAKLPFSL
jgi:hypothetical protein